MPPGASSFPASENSNQEVVCPLRNQDGSSCRKRCLGEKRYRSMQEHIRRAHPEYYLPKLPATKESFDLMIASTPHERPAQDPNRPQQSNNNHHLQQQQHQQHQQHSHHLSQDQQQQQQQQHPHHQHHHSDPSGLSPAFNLDTGLNSSFQGYNTLGGHDGGYYTTHDTDAAIIYDNMQAQQRTSDEYRRGSLIPAHSAAAALAQLQYHGQSDWSGGDGIGGQVIYPSMQISPTSTEADFLQNYYADTNDLKTNHFHVDPALEDTGFMGNHGVFPTTSAQDQPVLLPSSLAKSPPDRSSALPPLQRTISRGGPFNRSRKLSLSHQARLPKHERKKSKELAKRSSGDRNRLWLDLVDAAASATEEEGSRDLTPVPASPYQSPQVGLRTSLPPFALGSQFQSFQASPLNRAQTPPATDTASLDLQTFPSVDSTMNSNLSHHQHHDSTGSGSQFQIMNPSSIDSSSPLFTPATGNGSVSPVQIYCALCRQLCVLRDSFACTSCISGFCKSCWRVVDSERNHRREIECPRCHQTPIILKPFQLDFR